MTDSDSFFDKLFGSFSPTQKRNYARHRKVLDVEFWMWKHLRWPQMPILNVVWLFWTTLMDEGIVSTCKPRWGALTFSYLNDGFKPTLWHTWRQITHDQTDPYTGIYPDGAPKSLAQAQEWEEKWKKERIS